MGDWAPVMGRPRDAADLGIAGASRLYRYCLERGQGVVHDVEARTEAFAGAEAVSFTIETGRPQDPAYGIALEERVCVLFWPDGSRPPGVFILRGDFPETPHQNSVPEGFPPCLCVDDRPWIDARTTWSPRELVHRIRRWFERAGMGELHDAGQPMDPFFVGVQDRVIVPSDAFSKGGTRYVGVRRGERLPVVANAWTGGPYPAGAYPLHFHFCKAAGVRMGRVRTFPTTLAGLVAELDGLGVDLVRELGERIKEWSRDDATRGSTFLARVVVVIDVPTVDAEGAPMRNDHFGFSLEARIGDVGVALSLLIPADPSATSYVRDLAPGGQVDEGRLRKIRVVPVQVHGSFDPRFATLLSGREWKADGGIVLIGSGAIGSLVAEPMVREGRSTWTLVDVDVLLPHNLARHTLVGTDVGDTKTSGLAKRLRGILAGCECRTIEADALDHAAADGALAAAVKAASIVVDASASVQVGRAVSDMQGASRRASVFFNPAGDDAVLLVEDEGRSADLRSLEAAYYAAILTSPDMAGHLAKSADRIPYAGACRDVTSRMPAWRAQALSGLVAGALSASLDAGGPDVVVWRTGGDGSIKCLRFRPPQVDRRQVHGWTVMLPDMVEEALSRMRAERLPAETGGVLLGVVDGAAKRIDVVAALPQPKGSDAGPCHFDRGTAGLEGDVQAAVAATLDQVRYVGEWHSHPDGATSGPSLKDLAQVAAFTEILDADDCPMLMAIAHGGGINILLGRVV